MDLITPPPPLLMHGAHGLREAFLLWKQRFELYLQASGAEARLDKGQIKFVYVEFGYIASPRWAWKNGKCRQFDYSGCGGNNNNFFSYRDCMAQCKHMAQTTLTLLHILQDLKKQRKRRRRKLFTLTKLPSSVHAHIATALIPRRRHENDFPKAHNRRSIKERTILLLKNLINLSSSKIINEQLKRDEISKNNNHMFNNEDYTVKHDDHSIHNTKYPDYTKSKNNSKKYDTLTDKSTNAKANKNKPNFVRILLEAPEFNELPLPHFLINHWPNVLYSKNEPITLEDEVSVMDQTKLIFEKMNAISSKRQNRVEFYNKNTNKNKRPVFEKVYKNTQHSRNKQDDLLQQPLNENINSLFEYLIPTYQEALGFSTDNYETKLEENLETYLVNVKNHKNKPVVVVLKNQEVENNIKEEADMVKHILLRMIIHRGHLFNTVNKPKRVLNFSKGSLLTDLNYLQKKIYKQITNRRVHTSQ